MRRACASSILVAGMFSAPISNAQELPEFDDEDFQVLSVVDSSHILANSDGRDFLCYVQRNDEASYITPGFCIPYVSRSEARNADKALFEAAAVAAEAERAAAAEVSRQAEQRWEDDSRILSDRAKSAIENPTSEVAQLLTQLDPKKIRELIFEFARASNLPECRLKVHSGIYLYEGMASKIIARLSPDQSVEDPLIIQIVRERASGVVESMIAEGSLMQANDLSYVELKECE